MLISSSARRHLAVYGEIVYYGWHWQGGCPVNDLGDTVVLFGYLDARGHWIE